MKRKSPAKTEAVISPEILDGAKRSLATDRVKPAVKAMPKCIVCSGETTASANAAEQLCWVCRRLKVSAWREVEQQIPVQE